MKTTKAQRDIYLKSIRSLGLVNLTINDAFDDLDSALAAIEAAIKACGRDRVVPPCETPCEPCGILRALISDAPGKGESK